MAMHQLQMDDLMQPPVGASDPGTDHGEVFTRPWMVDFILDLVGYTADADLGAVTLIEPACGTGAFLVPVVARLISSADGHGRPLSSLARCIRAYDLLDANAHVARKAASSQLQDAGLDPETADGITAGWVRTGDFILDHDPRDKAAFVVGNPPYVRLESVPTDRMRRYRETCWTMRGRADLYVGFLEVGLSLLDHDGVLGFVCADRWMRNQYGAELRQVVASSFAVDAVVTMHDVDAFVDPVAAYPAVTVIRNGTQGDAAVVDTTSGFDRFAAGEVVAWSRRDAPTPAGRRTGVHRIAPAGVVPRSGPVAECVTLAAGRDRRSGGALPGTAGLVHRHPHRHRSGHRLRRGVPHPRSRSRRGRPTPPVAALGRHPCGGR